MDQSAPVVRTKPPFWSRERKIGAVILVALIAAVHFMGRTVVEARENARLASCRPRLVLSTVKGYSLEHEGLYAPLSKVPGRFMFDTEKAQAFGSIYDYMCGVDPFESSEEPVHDADDWRLDDWSYVYIGYVIENEAQGLAFLDAYAARIKSRGDFESDLPVGAGEGNAGQNTLLRLRAPETFTGDLAYLQSKASTIPVVVEWPNNHHKSGSKVVFLDGHEEIIPYPGKFPMTEKFITALKATNAAYPPYTP